MRKNIDFISTIINFCILSVSTQRKTRWSPRAIKAPLTQFPNALDENYTVSNSLEIKNFLKLTDNQSLKKRSEPQVRSWIYVHRKAKSGKADVPLRNHVPNYIYEAFEKYITAGQVPSAKTCGKFLAKSPSKANITINNIQNWVTMAINRKSK